MSKTDKIWTIDELSAQVSLALADGYAGQDSGRIRDLPDLRTIRYYTTIGLLDRPTELQGRTAMYGPRHLLQLVAIKRLQTHGLTLREIQQKLLGLSPGKLSAIAGIEVPTTTIRDRAERKERAFWKSGEEAPPSRSEMPMSAGAEHINAITPASGHLADEVASSVDEQGSGPQTLTGLPLSEGVVLLLEARYEPDADEMESIRIAAEPLLKLLEIRRLVRARTERKSS
ncbi:MAG: MerR family transcriptional regulator [Acidobacteriota bacterium]